MATEFRNKVAIPHVIVEPPRITLTSATSFSAPDAASLLAEFPEERRIEEIGRLLELGAQTMETLRTSTTLRLVEAQVQGMTAELSEQLGSILVKDRGAAVKETKELLDEHRARMTTALTRYLDPESQASLPVTMGKVFDEAGTALFKRFDDLLAEGDDSALGRLAARFSKELEKATALLLEQMAARHALLTKSSLAGRPYEDALEERLIAIARPLGDQVTRTGDTLGRARRRSGDIIITIAPDAVGGQDVCLVIEAKRRGEKAQGFTATEIQNSLAVARRNRGAMAGLFVVESAAFLPLGLNFHEFGGSAIAVAYNPEMDDVALAVAYRLLRWGLVQDAVARAGKDIDRDAHRRVVADLRAAMLRLDTVRAQHQAAVNCIGKASSAVEDLADDVLKGLRQLDDLMAA